MKYILLACAAVAITSGCATPGPSVSPLADKISAGETTALTKLEFTELVVGNTIRGPKGSATVLKGDGVKIIKTNDGKVVEREWYLDDEGLLCQTLLSSGDLMCLAERMLDRGNPDNL